MGLDLVVVVVVDEVVVVVHVDDEPPPEAVLEAKGAAVLCLKNEIYFYKRRLI